RMEAHMISEAKTLPHDEYGELISHQAPEAKTAYWKLEDELHASIVAGDEEAQQRVMTKLDAFVNARGREEESHENPYPIHEPDMTPRESHALLGKLIEGYKKSMEGIKWWKSSEEH